MSHSPGPHEVRVTLLPSSYLDRLPQPWWQFIPLPYKTVRNLQDLALLRSMPHISPNAERTYERYQKLVKDEVRVRPFEVTFKPDSVNRANFTPDDVDRIVAVTPMGGAGDLA